MALFLGENAVDVFAGQPVKSDMVLDTLTVTPTTTSQTITPSVGIDGWDEVNVNPIPNEYIIPSGTINITSNGTTNVSQYANASVNVSKEVSLESKSITPTESQQEITFDSGYDGLDTVIIGAISSTYIGSSIEHRDETDLTVSGATVNVPSGYYAENESKSVATSTHSNPTISLNSTTGLITASHSQSTGYVVGGTTSDTIQLTTQVAKTITPTKTSQTAVAANNYTLGTITVNAIPNEYIIPEGSTSITSNGTYDVTEFEEAVVAIPKSVSLQNKTATPTESAQSITSDNGYDGLGKVDIDAISSTYIGSDITIDPTPTTSGAVVTIPTGYYSEDTTKSVASGNAGTPTATKGSVSNHSISVTPSVTNTTGYITGSTETGTAVIVSASELVSGNKAITGNGTGIDVTNYATVSVDVSPNLQAKTGIIPTESSQTISADTTYDGLSSVQINAVSSTYVGSDISRRSISDTTVNWGANLVSFSVPEGYYESGGGRNINYTTASNPSISVDSNGLITSSLSLTQGAYNTQTVSATEQLTVRDSDDLTVSGATVTVPSGYYSSQASKAVSSMALPTSASSSASSGYTSKAIIGRSTSNQYINIPTGYNSAGAYYLISATPNGSVTAPSTISGTTATVSTGTNTITLTKSVSVTPNVTTAGYISTGTAGNSSVSLTANVTTKAAATITPGTTNQTIESGTYLTGTQTIAGDADLVASNIINGVQIFGVTGNVVLQNYYTGSSAPSSSLGNNGDLYLQNLGD